MKIEVTIPYAPVAKARPRMTKTGHTYTPEKTRQYEKIVQFCFNKKYGCIQQPLTDKPVSVTLLFYMPIPKSFSKKRIAELKQNKMACPKKPDIDNLTKAVLDALNGRAYKDDNQIVELFARKEYSEQPRTEIFISFKDG